MDPIKHETKTSQSVKDWDSIIKEWRLSKQTQREFCALRGLTYGTFVYHRCKKPHRKKQSNKAHPAFKEICLAPTKKFTASVLLKLQLPNGMQLEIPEQFSSEQLKQVLSVLGVIIC